MKTRREFLHAIADRQLSHVDRAVALLWFYRQTQEFDDRTPSELATDLHEDGFPRPNVTRLRRDLQRSRYTIRGRRPGSYQIDVRRLSELDEAYSSQLELRKVDVRDTLLASELVSGTRAYLERLLHQINGTYQFGFYDACAVLCRRLMESLIIEVYVRRNRHSEIQQNGVFRGLDFLIGHLKNDNSIPLARGSRKAMDDVKLLGDTAAHDRVYITSQADIDDIKPRYRRLIADLLAQAGLAR